MNNKTTIQYKVRCKARVKTETQMLQVRQANLPIYHEDVEASKDLDALQRILAERATDAQWYNNNIHLLPQEMVIFDDNNNKWGYSIPENRLKILGDPLKCPVIGPQEQASIGYGKEKFKQLMEKFELTPGE